MPRRRTKSPVAGLKRVKGRKPGSVYWYHRGTGKRLVHNPNSAAGLLEIARLDAEAGNRSAPAYSLADLIEDFKHSSDWRGFADNTRRMYEVDFKTLSAGARAVYPDALSDLEARGVINHAKENRGFRAAQMLLSHMSRVFEWGREHDKIKRNAFANVAKPSAPTKRKVVNRRIDTDELHAIFRGAAPEPGFQALLALQLFGGMRVGDARAVTRASRRNGRIQWTAEKNGVEMDIAVTGVFAEILDRAPACAATIATNSLGRPFTKGGADKRFAKLRADLEATEAIRPGITFHGLRHSLASLAKELGASDGQAANAINDKSARMGGHYGAGAELSTAGNALRMAVADQLKSLGMENRLENEAISDLSEARKRRTGSDKKP